MTSWPTRNVWDLNLTRRDWQRRGAPDPGHCGVGSVEDIQLRSDHHISMMDKHRAQDRTGRIFYSDCANTVCWWLGQYLAVKTFYHLLQYDKPSTAENTGQYTQNSLKKMIYSVIIIFEILRFLWWSVTYVNNPFGIHLHVWPFVDCTQHSNKNK